MSLQDVNIGDHASDLDAASALQKGDDVSTETFVRENIRWMVRTAERILKERSAAEDSVQAAFVKIFRSLDSFRGESSLRTWMRRIVVNQALMVLRKQERLRETSIEPLLPSFDGNGCRLDETWLVKDTPESLLASAQVSQAVMTAIDKLPDAYRLVLLLRDIEEYSTTQVAHMLELSESNVKVRLHRARAALKKLLDPVLAGEISK
jgi:RNA polymerase sigma-70 factor (ECF subfamily)